MNSGTSLQLHRVHVRGGRQQLELGESQKHGTKAFEVPCNMSSYGFLPHNEDGKANKGNEGTSNAYHGKHPIVDLTVI